MSCMFKCTAIPVCLRVWDARQYYNFLEHRYKSTREKPKPGEMIFDSLCEKHRMDKTIKLELPVFGLRLVGGGPEGETEGETVS